VERILPATFGLDSQRTRSQLQRPTSVNFVGRVPMMKNRRRP
jgi:hypothetical protein